LPATLTRSGHILQAMRVWPKRACVPSGRVSRGEGRQMSWWMQAQNHANAVREHLHKLYVHIEPDQTW